MLEVIFLFLLHAHYASLQQDNSCIECASQNLKSRWSLTGFTRQLPEESFSANCLELTGDTTALQTTCSGQCVTYMFEDPDLDAGAPNRIMVARGCLKKLVELETRSSSTTTSATICEYDKDFVRPNSHGKLVKVKALSELCTGKLCNAKITKTFDATCTGQNTDMYQNSELKCYDCEADNANCNSVQMSCTKKYCYKGLVDIHGKKSVYKTCADFNPYGTNAACGHAITTMVPLNIAKVGITVSQCFCKDGLYCNGAYKVTAFTLLPLLLLPQVLVPFIL